MTREEAKQILDQHKEGRIFLPRTIRQALSVSEQSESLDPYGIDEGVETTYLVQGAAIGE